MNSKIFGIFIVLLLMVTVIPITAQISIIETENNIKINDEKITAGPIPPENYDKGIKYSSSQIVIPNVPSYKWRHGCGPTACGMVLGYYDGQNYSYMVPGDASTQTDAVNQMIASGGTSSNPNPPGSEEHYEDYARPQDSQGNLKPDDYLTQGRTPHTSNSIADYMKTSRSTEGNWYGSSHFSHTSNGLTGYVFSHTPYGVITTIEWWGGLTWSNYKEEIDNNRPVLLLVDSDGDGEVDHLVTGIGYDDDAMDYGCYNTWDHNVHWYDFSEISSGNPFGIRAGIFVQFSGAGDDDDDYNRIPRIRIIEPYEESVVNATINITGAADNPGGATVKWVLVKIDDGNWVKADGTNSWSSTWDTTTVEDGEHTISAVASDGAKESGIKTINVIVQNNEPDPEDPIPTLNCEGTLNWGKIKAGLTIFGEFSVENIGEPQSNLSWTITETPDWGTWTFSKMSGNNLRPEEGPQTIAVTLTTPNEENTHEGQITITNDDDPTQTCTISVTLTTPKTYNNFIITLIQQIINQNPLMNLILKMIT